MPSKRKPKAVPTMFDKSDPFGGLLDTLLRCAVRRDVNILVDVVALANHAVNFAPLVVYRSVTSGNVWVCDLEVFRGLFRRERIAPRLARGEEHWP